MQTIAFQIDLPSDLLPILRLSRLQMEQQIHQWVALELFRQRKISAGRAAKIAQLTIEQFMELTHQHDIEWVNYTAEELDDELQQALELGKTLRKR